MTDFTYVVTVDQGKFAKKALYQVKSIIQNDPGSDIFAYVTTGRGTESITESEREGLEKHATVVEGPVPIPDYPISAKTRAAAEAASCVDTEYLLVLDSDMLVLEPLSVPSDTDLSMTPVNIGNQEWGRPEKEAEWERLCEQYDIEYPDTVIHSTVDDRPLPFPMYNVGVVFVRNDDFPARWERIESEMYEEFGAFHFLHQIAASLLAADYSVNVLDERYNYPSNIRYRCPKDIKILHYHSFNQLRKLMHPEIRRKVEATGILEQQDPIRSLYDSIYTPIRLRFLRSILK